MWVQSVNTSDQPARLTMRPQTQHVTMISVIQTFRPQEQFQPTGTLFTDGSDLNLPEAEESPPSLLNSELPLNLMSVYDFSTVEWQHSLLFVFVMCTHTDRQTHTAVCNIAKQKIPFLLHTVVRDHQ